MRLQRRLLHDFLLQHTLRAEDDTRRYLVTLRAKGYDNLLALKLRVRAVEDLGELGVDKVRRNKGIGGLSLPSTTCAARARICVCSHTHATPNTPHRRCTPSRSSPHSRTWIPTRPCPRSTTFSTTSSTRSLSSLPSRWVRGISRRFVFIHHIVFYMVGGLVPCDWFGFVCVDGRCVLHLSCVASLSSHTCIFTAFPRNKQDETLLLYVRTFEKRLNATMQVLCAPFLRTLAYP